MSLIMKILLSFCLVFTAQWGFAQSAETAVVAIHGKWGSPPGPLANYLERESYRVISPAMPWSRAKDYASDYPSAIAEIQQEVKKLRDAGHKKVVLAGHSFGANAAIAYATQHQDVDGIILYAPGHTPELFYRGRFIDLSADVDRARQLVDSGRGDEKITFQDPNSGGRKRSLSAPAKNYLSFFDPEGVANMPKSAGLIPVAIPVMCVMSREDNITKWGPNYIFTKFQKHPKSVYFETSAGHLDTLEAMKKETLAFLSSL